MDIRDELRQTNRKLSVLQCPDFIKIPAQLDRIRRNTTRKRRPKTKCPKDLLIQTKSL